MKQYTREELIELIERECKPSETLKIHHSSLKTLYKKYPNETTQILEITKDCKPSTPK